MRRLLVFGLLAACGADDASDDTSEATTDEVADSTDGTDATCPAGDVTKLQFTRADGCANDSSVEFCIPEGNAALEATLAGISEAITCAPGGGRARCNATPGLLLCFYPTTVPEQCETDDGAMTAAAWSDMCALTALPEITAIVPTIFE